MAATDYTFEMSGLGNIYLARKIKSATRISSDRRLVTDNEIIAMFENYLRRRAEENNNPHLVITQGGKTIFEATLIDTEK